MSWKYDDIINMPRYVSSRPKMSMADRAAQFSPFKALTGLDDSVSEAGRLTEDKIEMNQEALDILSLRYQLLVECLDKKPEVQFVYFRPDDKKDGGAYVTLTGVVRKVDAVDRVIIMQNGDRIPMDDILGIEGEMFEKVLF